MSKQSAAGARFVREVVAYLVGQGVPARRAETYSPNGDIYGIPSVSVECKAHATLELPKWLAQSTTSALRQGGLIPIVVHKRRNKGTKEAYVTMNLDSFVRLLGNVGLVLDR